MVQYLTARCSNSCPCATSRTPKGNREMEEVEQRSVRPETLLSYPNCHALNRSTAPELMACFG